MASGPTARDVFGAEVAAEAAAEASASAVPGAAAFEPPDPEEPLAGVVAEVDRLLAGFLPEQRRALAELDAALAPLAEELSALLTGGGKRLRPAFVYWGHRAAGAAHDGGVLHPAAAVELLHAFALIHDDVMDRGHQRRGRPTVHRAMAEHHRRAGLRGDPDWFGVGAATLGGDLVFVWADALFDRAPIDPAALQRARQVFTRLRVEVMAGQYLDLRLAGLPAADERSALRVALLKSGRYTVTRPLQLGAAIGGADDARQGALAAYGDALGIAFQLRDDVLGLFGDPADTGKAAAEDLREGKRTPLVLRALALADPAGRRVLEDALGDAELEPGDVDRVREVVADSGALAAIEEVLAAREAEAHAALASVGEPARTALAHLAELAARRRR